LQISAYTFLERFQRAFLNVEGGARLDISVEDMKRYSLMFLISMHLATIPLVQKQFIGDTWHENMKKQSYEACIAT